MMKKMLFILFLSYTSTLLFCGSNMDDMLDDELSAVKSDVSVNILSPANDEYIAVFQKTEKIDSSGNTLKDEKGNTVFEISDKKLVLKGEAYDENKKLITDDKLYIWKSDKDGEIGKARELILEKMLSSGTHKISLTVKNNYKRKDTAEITIHVPKTFSEDFSTKDYCDTTATTGVWDTASRSGHLGSYADPYINYDLVSTCRINGNTNAVSVLGNYAYIADSSKGLVVVDISDITNPVISAILSIASPLNKIIIKENYAYIGNGNKGIKIIDISQPTNPIIVGTYKYNSLGYVLDIVIDGNYLFYADQNNGTIILDITNKSSPILKNRISVNNSVNGVAIENNYLYIAASMSGLLIYDVGVPENPIFLGQNNIITNAIDVEVSNGYVYLSNGFNEELQKFTPGIYIVDCRNPLNPNIIYSIVEQGKNLTRIQLNNNKLYYCSGLSGLYVYDIINNTSLKLIGKYDTDGKANDIFVYNNFSLIADDYNGLVILNTGKHSWPIKISSMFHNQFLFGRNLTLGKNIIYICDAYLGLSIVNVQNPQIPIFLGGFYENNINNDGIVVNDFKDVLVKDNIAYCVVKDKGLYILDISDPTNVKKLSHFNFGITGNFTNLLAIKDSMLYYTHRIDGFSILDISDKMNPISLSMINTSSVVNGLFILNNYLYVSNDVKGLYCYDLSNGFIPELKFTSSGLTSSSLFVSENLAFSTDKNTMKTDILYIQNYYNLTYVKSIFTKDFPKKLFFHDNKLFISAKKQGLLIYDVGNPNDPVLIGHCKTTGNNISLAVDNNYAYTLDYSGGLSIIGISKLYHLLYSENISQIIQSKKVAESVIKKVRYYEISNNNNQQIVIELSTDSGNTWFSANEFVVMEISELSKSTSLIWRARMQTTNRYETPKSTGLKLSIGNKDSQNKTIFKCPDKPASIILCTFYQSRIIPSFLSSNINS